jgi:DNA-binding IclR family transcriptional regulator
MDRAGVQSIERAFAILAHIAGCDGVSLAELSKSVHLHNSTTFNLVRTMAELGVVRQDKETKRYHLGRLIFALAAKSATEMELIDAATPFLERLSARTGETSHLALMSGADVIIAARIRGAGAFQLVERAGEVRPFNCTAVGKVLLSGMDDSRLTKLIAAKPLAQHTAKSIVEPEQLLSEVAKVRETGLGFDDAEFNSEVRCVAAPVFDVAGRVIAALGVSGPVWRVSLQRLQVLSQEVSDAAKGLSQQFGSPALVEGRASA